jgi:hypothetical protein
MYVLVDRGLKLAKTPAAEITLKRSEDKILFTSPKSTDTYFVYDIASEKTKKYNLRPDIAIDIRDCEDEGDCFYTQKYKYTISDTSIVKTQLETLKETEVVFYNADKDRTVFTYSASNFTAENETIYFTAFFAGSTYLCKYDGDSDSMKSVEITGFKNYLLHNEEIYVLGIETNREYNEYDKAVTITKDVIFVYDMQLNLKRKLYVTSVENSITNFIICDNGIYVTEHSAVSLYSFNGEKTRELHFNRTLYYIYTCKENNEHYFYDSSSKSVIKYSQDFSVETVICERLLMPEHDFMVWPMPSAMLEKDGIIYYAVCPSWVGDDSFAFCKVDKDGNAVTIMKEKKSFLRNFFKSNFR